MLYHVESIGSSFSDKDIDRLSKQLTSRGGEGWEFHSVFSIQKRGCLGSNEGTTYLAVYKKER